jgi:type VI protein secretion system component Hcp
MPMSFLPQNESYRHMEQVSFVYEEIEWNWLPDSAVEMDRWRAPGGG